MSAPTIDIRRSGPNDAGVLGSKEAWIGAERTTTPARSLHAAASGTKEPERAGIASLSME